MGTSTPEIESRVVHTQQLLDLLEWTSFPEPLTRLDPEGVHVLTCAGRLYEGDPDTGVVWFLCELKLRDQDDPWYCHGRSRLGKLRAVPLYRVEDSA